MTKESPWIKNGQLKTLSTRVSIPRVSKDVYDILRECVVKYMNGILEKTFEFTYQSGRKTVHVKDLYAALEVHGRHIVGDINHNISSKDFKLNQNKFKEYIRQKSKSYEQIPNFRFSKDFFRVFQHLTEQYILDICRRSFENAKHAGRKGLAGKDVQYTLTMRS
jgi:histone H3/H4